MAAQIDEDAARAEGAGKSRRGMILAAAVGCARDPLVVGIVIAVGRGHGDAAEVSKAPTKTEPVAGRGTPPVNAQAPEPPKQGRAQPATRRRHRTSTTTRARSSARRRRRCRRSRACRSVFVFKKSGYEDLSTTVVPNSDQDVPAVLTAAPKRSRRVTRTRPRTRPPRRSTARRRPRRRRPQHRRARSIRSTTCGTRSAPDTRTFRGETTLVPRRPRASFPLL